MNNQNNNSLTDKLSFLSDALQIFNTYLNIKQTTSDEIMKELEKQDDVFFKQIIDRLSNIEEKICEIENHIKNNS